MSQRLCDDCLVLSEKASHRSGMFSLNVMPPTLMSDGTRTARATPIDGRKRGESRKISMNGPPGTLSTPARTLGVSWEFCRPLLERDATLQECLLKRQGRHCQHEPR